MAQVMQLAIIVVLSGRGGGLRASGKSIEQYLNLGSIGTIYVLVVLDSV